MKLVSWNVNGIRAILKKNFYNFFVESNADVYCLQEIKIHDADISDEVKNIGALNGYDTFFNGAKRKGYSGTGIISRIKPISVKRGFGVNIFDDEGRVQVFELENFFLLNVYAPNAQHGLLRLGEKIEFNKKFLNYCERLRLEKPVIFCGDLNVAHKEIDLTNPKQNESNPGFSIEERDAFSDQLDKGYLDTFRLFNNKPNQYTWWSYRFNSRKRNIGWRIDYFVVSNELKNNIVSSNILPNVLGSDHCPIELTLNF